MQVSAQLGFEKYPKSLLDNATMKKSSGGPTKEHLALKSKKAWELAYSPAKNIPMQAFLMWMAGNGIQIFSISITAMLLYNPIKAILSLSATFRPYEDRGVDLWAVKAVFVALQVANFALGVWKVGAMGLLPAQSDFLNYESVTLFSQQSLISY